MPKELNAIYLQDCIEGMKEIETETIDLVITDCPYRIIPGGSRKSPSKDEPGGILNRRKEPTLKTHWSDNSRKGKIFEHNDIKFADWLPEVFRILKNGTHFYVMVNDRNVQEMLNEGEKAGFQLVNILVWKKNNATPNRYYMKNGEFIILFRKGQARTINQAGTKSVFEVPNILGNKLHPTEKPVELNDIMLVNSSNEGDVVCDPFMGSGSVAISAIKHNRNFIGFELDPSFHKIANDRIKEFKEGKS